MPRFTSGRFFETEHSPVLSSQQLETARSEVAMRQFTEDVDMDPWFDNQSEVEIDTPLLALGNDVKDFLDPNTKIDGRDQLHVVHRIWEVVGKSMPELSSDQKAKVSEIAEAIPSFRVMPAPFMSLQTRYATALEFPRLSNEVPSEPETSPLKPLERAGDDEALTAKDPELFEKLTSGSIVMASNSLAYFRVFYKTYEGKLVDRLSFISGLVAGGIAVRSEAEEAWTFPLIDIREKPEEIATHEPSAASLLVRDDLTKPALGNIWGLYETVDPIISPESLLLNQLMHRATNTPVSRSRVDIANEAIHAYSSSKKFSGKPKDTELIAVASVQRSGDQVQLGNVQTYGWYGVFNRMARRDGSTKYRTRSAISGL